MLLNKIIDNKLNLFLIHSKKDEKNKKELILVKSNKKIYAIILEIKNRFGIKTTINKKSWIPLQSIIETINSLEDRYRIYYSKGFLENMHFFKSTMSKTMVRLPNKITNDLVYIIGVIIGDGSLPKYSKRKIYHVYICGTNKKYLIKISSLMKKLFKLEYVPKGRIRNNKKVLYEWRMSSKPLFRFISTIFEVPAGKKSNIVKWPSLIKPLDREKQISFISGLMDTDWGSEFYTFGSGCASLELLKDTLRSIESITKIENLKIIERPLNAKKRFL